MTKALPGNQWYSNRYCFHFSPAHQIFFRCLFTFAEEAKPYSNGGRYGEHCRKNGVIDKREITHFAHFVLRFFIFIFQLKSNATWFFYAWINSLISLTKNIIFWTKSQIVSLFRNWTAVHVPTTNNELIFFRLSIGSLYPAVWKYSDLSRTVFVRLLSVSYLRNVVIYKLWREASLNANNILYVVVSIEWTCTNMEQWFRLKHYTNVDLRFILGRPYLLYTRRFRMW